MLRSTAYFLIATLSTSFLGAEEPNQSTRPISTADSVVAIYREDWRLISSAQPSIILVAWPDGKIIWSEDRLQGGPPYRTGYCDPKKISALLAGFNDDGLFADKQLNQPHFGPDSQFVTLFLKSGKQQLKMQSWHELFEATNKHVVDHHGASALEGRRRLDVLRKAPADYLFFRFVWSETRNKLTNLIPSQSHPTSGKPHMNAGKLSWQQPPKEN